LRVFRLREVVAKTITIIKFGVNDGGDKGTSCCEIEVRKDTTKLSNMIIARFGEGRNLVGKCKVFIKDAAKVASRVAGIK